MLKSEIEFKKSDDFYEMWWESDAPPFNDVLLGCLRKDSDGYYRFNTARKAVLTCKHARFLAEKLSELNTNENN